MGGKVLGKVTPFSRAALKFVCAVYFWNCTGPSTRKLLRDLRQVYGPSS